MPKNQRLWPQPAQQPLPARRAVRQVPPHPGRHRLAVAHRTTHPVHPGRRVLAAGHLDHPHLGRHHPRPGSWPWPSPCRTPAGSSPGAPGASWPGTASRGCATRPGCTPAPGGSRSSCGPGRPRSANAPGCCAARASAPRTSTPTSASSRRLLRPRRAGHPQPPVVAPADHRHHPPRHPRGPRDHRLPAGAADRALPHRPARAGPPAGLSPRRGRARRVTRHGGPRRHPGAACPTPKETP